MTVAAVILAAGEARRAGGPKVTWKVGGLPSVRRVALAALAAAEVTEVVAVTGGWADEVAAALAGLAVRLIPNPDYGQGQSASLKAALAGLGPVIRTAVFLLADQPLITSQIIDDLVQFHKKSGATLTAPLVQGRRANPAVFDLGRWGAGLTALTGDAGGRNLLAAHPGELALWPAGGAPAECFRDFDTSEELARLTACIPTP